jgi:hypothetical protein
MLFLGYMLRQWDHLELISNGEALMAEMVEDSVKTTGVPDPEARWSDLDDLALIRVRLVLLDQGVVIEVADCHNQPPTWADAVTSLCSRWNSYPTNAGRLVWCELEFPQYELTERGLPKRPQPKATDANRPPAPPVDPEVLSRVLEGLKGL